MNKYEKTVLDHFFASYPNGLCYGEIMDKLYNDNLEKLIIWEPFTYKSSQWIMGRMEDLRETLTENFEEK